MPAWANAMPPYSCTLVRTLNPGGVTSKASRRFEPGELGKVDKVKVKRSRVDLLLTLDQPVLASRLDGPFELFDERPCKVQLIFEMPREWLSREDLETIVVASDELVFHQVGTSGQNVAITAMSARRSYERPEQVDVFASVANYGPEPVTRDVQLAIDGDVRTVRSVTIPGREAQPQDGLPQPGKRAVSFALSHEGQGVLEVRQLGRGGVILSMSAGRSGFPRCPGRVCRAQPVAG